MATCPGSLIVHADGTIAGCTEDDERDGCQGRGEWHDGGTMRCIKWFADGCNQLRGFHLDRLPIGARRITPDRALCARIGEALVGVPNLPGKDTFASIYTANDFVGHLRKNGWDPGRMPHGVIFTYGGFDLLCGAQPEQYAMNPMLGPGPGRFFTANAVDGHVGICCMGIGAPAVAAQLEVLIALGAHEFLSLGTAGGLHPDQAIGDVVVLTGAVRDEGVSHHYVAPDATVRPNVGLTEALRDRLLGTGMSAAEGSTWTTDAPYRETGEEIAHYRDEGVLTVEMEAAALFAVAEARRVPLASAVVLDAVIGDPISAPTMDTSAAFGKLYDVFLVGVDVLAERA